MTRKLIKLYLCSDESGSLHIKEVKGGPLEQSDLDSNDAFIIDNGQLGIWVWIGKKATRQERAEAMRNAQGFIKKKGKHYLNSDRKLRNTLIDLIISNGQEFYDADKNMLFQNLANFG